MPSDRVRSIEVFTLTVPRDVPYMGSLRIGEAPNARGYFLRNGTRTVYPSLERSIVIRVRTQGGLTGWGETYGLFAPGAVAAIIDDLLAPFVTGRDPLDAAAIHDDLYDLMRVRGYTGGFYLDALAAIDIALWDLAGKLTGLPIAKLLGGRHRDRIPAYVSGLPGPTLEARGALARDWQKRGFSAFKFYAPMGDVSLADEVAGLRSALGPAAKIACDMHWDHSPEEAIALIRAMEPHGLWFAEAPVKPENIEGLAKVARSVGVPVATGEEWRTVFDFVPRVEKRACAIVQPEMGHKGITEFMRIGLYAQAHHIRMIPHSAVGLGIFLAASLQASAALGAVEWHEFQHTVFEPNRVLLTGDMDCRDGAFTVPTGAGLGVEPSEAALRLLERCDGASA